jgi:ABC-2 type transport system ATP-binding protein
MAPTVIDVSQLRKTYGRTVAVDDVSFSVRAEEIFGILGPNGAGKTTTVECIIGMRRPDAGTIRVLDLNPESDQDRGELHTLVGAQLQVSALPAKLTVRENLDLYRSFYHQPADVAELVSVLGLGDKLDSYYQDLSGGQKQRLAVAVALIGQPKIAVLDEMTTGLDPRARRATWELIEGIRARGVTILLVTHYMDEAQRLCDRVALFDQGRVVALGTPSELATEAGGGKHVTFVPSRPFDDRLLTDLPDVTSVEHQGPRVLVTGKGELVNAVIQSLAANDVTAEDVTSGSATLEDAFLRLTGRHIHEPEEAHI